MNRAGLYILGLLIFLGVGYLFVVHIMERSAPIFSTGSGSAEVTVARINDSQAGYVVDVEYPQFGIPAIDAQIKKMVEDAVAEFEAMPPNPPDSATPQNQFTGRFDKVYVGPDIVSLELILSQYTGGAHNLTLFSGIDFDRTTGKQLLQSDAFKLIGMTADQVSQGATTQLKAALGDGFQFPEGADSNPENFSSFLIGSSTVTFIFQEYQVAAYAAGPQQAVFERKI